jgi:uncharacterized membrane protein HdeD (DUF308 family)
LLRTFPFLPIRETKKCLSEAGQLSETFCEVGMKKSSNGGARAGWIRKEPAIGGFRLPGRYWWLLAQGIFAIIFGVMAIFWPKLTVYFFLRLFGAYALIDGVPPLLHAAFGRRRALVRGRWILWIEGIVSVAVGLICLLLPKLESKVLFYVIAIWLLFKGFSFVLQTPSRGWLMGVAGVLALATAIYILINPAAGFRLLLLVVGSLALLLGVILLFRGWRARAAQRGPRDLGAHPAM